MCSPGTACRSPCIHRDNCPARPAGAEAHSRGACLHCNTQRVLGNKHFLSYLVANVPLTPRALCSFGPLSLSSNPPCPPPRTPGLVRNRAAAMCDGGSGIRSMPWWRDPSLCSSVARRILKRYLVTCHLIARCPSLKTPPSPGFPRAT